MPNVSSSVSGTYDFSYDTAGLVTKMVNRDGSNTYVYIRDQGLLISEQRTTATAETTTTYQYSANSAGYSSLSGDITLSSYAYSLNAQGYPLAITPLNRSASSPGPARYEYMYDGCRMIQRVAYLDNGAVDDTQTQQYAYDSAGRVVQIMGHMTKETFDYSCW